MNRVNILFKIRTPDLSAVPIVAALLEREKGVDRPLPNRYIFARVVGNTHRR
jgi:hypothetical protein